MSRTPVKNESRKKKFSKRSIYTGKLVESACGNMKTIEVGFSAEPVWWASILSVSYKAIPGSS